MATSFDLNGTISSSLRETVKSSSPGERSWAIPPGRILANQRWRQSVLLECLKKNHCQVMFTEDASGVVDFYPSEGVAVVYLSEADCVLNTTYDYKRKLAKLRNNRGLRGMVLFERSEMTKQYLMSVQQFAVLDLGLVFLTVADQAEAAQLLSQISNVENNERGNPFRIKKCSPPVEEAVLQTALQVPGLGETKAKQLVTRYKSISNICRANKDEMAAIIGKNAANQVWNFFR